MLDAVLEADVLGDRLLLNKVFLQLAPMNICSPSIITSACEFFFEFFNDTLVDFPKAADYCRDLFHGTIIGYESKREGAPKGIIPPSILPTILAEKMDVKKPTTPAPAPAPAPAPLPAPLAPINVPSAVSTSPANVPSSYELDTPTVMSQETATPMPELSKADLIADEIEEEDLFALAKKKKKATKKAATTVEE
jgi:hypothetical protein